MCIIGRHKKSNLFASHEEEEEEEEEEVEGAFVTWQTYRSRAGWRRETSPPVRGRAIAIDVE